MGAEVPDRTMHIIHIIGYICIELMISHATHHATSGLQCRLVSKGAQGTWGVTHGTHCPIEDVTGDNVDLVHKGGMKHP